MTWDEMRSYFSNMLNQIIEFKPDEIIAVNRSGHCYAMWAAQILKLPLGVYWPDRSLLVKRPESSRLVFVDDNMLKGTTFIETAEYLKQQKHNIQDWRWAVLFTDWNTPVEIQNRIIYGTRLDYFAVEPLPGSMKISAGPGLRHRDDANVGV
jgi:hypoxanthine phosphoribosyltransferase